MSKLSVRNAIAVSFPKFEIEDEVQTYFDEQEDERHSIELERDESWLYWQQYSQPRNFTLSFYNFMVGAGSAVIDLYRRFDHVLMTWMQARDTMIDVANELADLIEAAGNEVGQIYDEEEDHVEVSFLVYDDEYTEYHWYTAYVSIVQANEVDVTPRKVDALDDRYWLSEDEFQKKLRINELETEIESLSARIEVYAQQQEHAWSQWVWWVKEGRTLAERICWPDDSEHYLEGRRYEARKSAIGAIEKLDKAKAELRKLKSELRKLAA